MNGHWDVEPETDAKRVSVTWRRVSVWQWGIITTLASLVVWFVLADRSNILSLVSQNISKNVVQDERIYRLEAAVTQLPTKAEIRQIMDDSIDRGLRERGFYRHNINVQP